MGVTPVIIHFIMDFPRNKPFSYWGTPMTMEPPYWKWLTGQEFSGTRAPRPVRSTVQRWKNGPNHTMESPKNPEKNSVRFTREKPQFPWQNHTAGPLYHFHIHDHENALESDWNNLCAAVRVNRLDSPTRKATFPRPLSILPPTDSTSPAANPSPAFCGRTKWGGSSGSWEFSPWPRSPTPQLLQWDILGSSGLIWMQEESFKRRGLCPWESYSTGLDMASSVEAEPTKCGNWGWSIQPWHRAKKRAAKSTSKV